MNLYGESVARCFLYKSTRSQIVFSSFVHFVSNLEEITRVDIPLQVCKDSKSNLSPAEYPHMTCEINGRPCCMGNEAICKIVSKDECEFYGGRYHENYTLCSQVRGLLSYRKSEETRY